MSDAVVIIIQPEPIFDLSVFSCSCVGSSNHSACVCVLCRSEAVLPMLTFVQKRGNVTFYEWRTGEAPTVVERPVVEEAPADAITEDTVGLTDTSKQAQMDVCMCPFITVLHS